MSNSPKIFGRINSTGNVDVLTVEDGERVTCITNRRCVYPIGSNLSTHYNHPAGIVLTLKDAKKIGLEIER